MGSGGSLVVKLLLLGMSASVVKDAVEWPFVRPLVWPLVKWFAICASRIRVMRGRRILEGESIRS